MPSRRYDAIAGAVAAGLALGIGELATSADAAGPSLVSAVGDEFIDRFAASLKDLAVRWFGTNDKAALVVGIVVVAVSLGAALGVATRRAAWAGPVGFAGFGILGFLAYRQAPLVDAGVGALAAVAAACAGSVALWFLLGRIPGPVAPSAPGAVPMIGATRRRFLRDAGLLGVGAAGAAALGRRSRGADPGAEVRASTELPDPVTSIPVPPQPFAEPGLTPYITPTEDFYRIDTALTIPRIDPARWSLAVEGHVDHPFSLTFDELLAMDAVEVPVTLQCVSNESAATSSATPSGRASPSSICSTGPVSDARAAK